MEVLAAWGGLPVPSNLTLRGLDPLDLTGSSVSELTRDAQSSGCTIEQMAACAVADGCTGEQMSAHESTWPHRRAHGGSREHMAAHESTWRLTRAHGCSPGQPGVREVCSASLCNTPLLTAPPSNLLDPSNSTMNGGQHHLVGGYKRIGQCQCPVM